MPRPPSQGERYLPIRTGKQRMREASLVFLFRMAFDLAPPAARIRLGPSSGRTIIPIIGGEVKGPGIDGTVQGPGADWALKVPGPDLAKMDARYTLTAADGEVIFVQSNGVFQPRQPSEAGGMAKTITQDDAEMFTRLSFEADVHGKYAHLNAVMAVGVMAFYEGRLYIDAYRFTNFPGEPMREWKL